MSPPSIHASAARSPCSSAAAKSAWSSRSVGIGHQNLLRRDFRLSRLGEQNRQEGELPVPLDERGHRPETGDRMAIESPDGVGNGRAMIVDQQRRTVAFDPRMAGEMNL